jgi:hypothetical protein
MEANRERPHDSDKASYLFPAQKKRSHFQLPVLAEPIQGTDSKTAAARPLVRRQRDSHMASKTYVVVPHEGRLGMSGMEALLSQETESLPRH